MWECAHPDTPIPEKIEDEEHEDAENMDQILGNSFRQISATVLPQEHDAKPFHTMDAVVNTTCSFMQYCQRQQEKEKEMIGRDSMRAEGGQTPATTTSRERPVASASVPMELFMVPFSKVIAMIASNANFFENTLRPSVRAAMMEAKGIQNPIEISPRHVQAVCREAYYPFKSCAMGKNCTVNTTVEFGFVMMAYLSPAELDTVYRDGKVPDTPGLCYCCLLYLYNNALCYQRERKSSCSYVNVAFYHKVDFPGCYKHEYAAASVTSVTDQEADTPVHLQPKCGTESSGGLVHHIRRWCPKDYICVQQRAVVPPIFEADAGQRERPMINALEERRHVFFVEPSSNKTELPKVQPFIYMRHTIDHAPTTVEMLIRYFSAEGKSSDAVGRGRMRTLCHVKNSVVTLPVYWAWQNVTHFRGPVSPNGFQAFPFEYIFCKDVRETVAHLDSLLVAGRIDIGTHLENQDDRREVLNYLVDLRRPLSSYGGQLAGMTEDRKLRLAHTLRVRVLDSVLAMHPNSKTTTQDAVVRKLLCILLAWNTKHYQPIFAQAGCPIDHALLDAVLAVPVPIYYFSATFDFLKLHSNLAVNELPSLYIESRCATEDKWAFSEFTIMRERLQSAAAFSADSVRRMWRARRYFDVPGFFAQLDSFPVAQLLRNHSIVWCLVVRVNMALHLETECMGNLEILMTTQRTLEEQFVRQSNSDATSKSTQSPEDNGLLFSRTTAEPHVQLEDVLAGRRIVHEEERYAYMLRLFAYTHMDLAQRILDLEVLRDDELCVAVPRPGKNNFLTHYEECYPYPSNTPHQGMLPDLSNMVTCVNFIGNNSAEPRGGNESRIPCLLYMWRKFLPRCCQGRNKDLKHIRCCEANEAYLQLTLNCLELSLLGAYQHCTRRPTYLRALQVHKTLGTHYTRDSFLELQRAKPMMNVLAMIEALVFFTKCAPAYRDYVIAKYPAYVNFEKRILARADAMRRRWGQQGWSDERTETMVRRVFSNTAVNTDDLCGNLLSTMLDKEVNNAHVFRTICVDPISMLCGHITVVNRKRYQGQKTYVRPDMPVLLQRAIVARVQSMEPNAPINLALVLNEFNFGFCATKASELNIQPYTLTRLHAALELITDGEPASFVEKALREIPPKDWEIVDLFMNTLATHNCFNLLPLSDEICEKQKRALERRYGVASFDDIEYCSRALVVTQCCGPEVRTYDSHSTNCTSYGHNNISIDPENRRIVCRRNRVASSARKRKRSDRSTYNAISTSLPTDNNERLLRTYKILRRRAPVWTTDRAYRYQPLCGKSPVIMLPLVGYVVQVTERRPSTNIKTSRVTNAFTVCCNCGSVCGFSRGLYGINGFSCTECEKRHVLHMMTPRCVACDVYLKLEACATWKRFMVFDDRWSGGDMLLKAFYVCTRCLNTKNSLFYEDHILLRSELHSAKYSSTFKHLLQLRDGTIDLRSPSHGLRKGRKHAVSFDYTSE